MKAIAAMARNRVIGSKGKIPWHLPADFRWFKRATLGGAVVMGRKTFESLGKPLPGRLNIVLSRTRKFPGVENISTVEDFLARTFTEPEVWLIGGAELYSRLLTSCSELYLSLVDAEPDGDAYFPPFEDQFRFREIVEKHADFEVRRYCRITLPASGEAQITTPPFDPCGNSHPPPQQSSSS